MAYRIVHYINQFYGGIGGEEKAGHGPEVREGFIGPGIQIEKLFKEDGHVVGTVICGDGYYGENTEDARAKCLEMIRKMKPDILFAGPAFNAGRYGFACGDIAAAAGAELGIPTVTAMYPENPGAELYSKKTYIAITSDSARGMAAALSSMVNIGRKLLGGEYLGPARLEGYIHRGIRKSFFNDKCGAERAVEMLLAKLGGEPFRTEYEMPVFKKIPPAKPVKNLKTSTIALISSGGIVPKGNPDHIRVSSAESFGTYDISQIKDMTPDNYESIHGGYDREWANIDPDVVLPLDVMRELEAEGIYGKLHHLFYTTTGTGTAVANAEKFGAEIGEQLKKAGVDAAILTST
mgnify:CR=1 FL=1